MQKQKKFQNKFFICHIKYRNKQWEINSVVEDTAYIRVVEGSIPSFPTTSCEREDYWFIAQPAEHPTVNRKVMGSSPIVPVLHRHYLSYAKTARKIFLPLQYLFGCFGM